MKIKLYKSVALCSLLALAGCHDFEELNTNPYAPIYDPTGSLTTEVSAVCLIGVRFIRLSPTIHLIVRVKFKGIYFSFNMSSFARRLNRGSSIINQVSIF